jgi:hypothetical protein
MKIGNVEGTPDELKKLLVDNGLNVKEYFPQKSKHRWIGIIFAMAAVFIIFNYLFM